MARDRKRDGRASKPGRKRDGHVREQVLEAAREVFAEFGYGKSRITDIVARAGCGTGSFYQYFPTKDDVFLAVVGQTVEEIKVEMAVEEDRSFDLAERLLERNRRYFETYRRHASLMLALEEAVAQRPMYRELRLKIREDYISPISKHIQRLQKSGQCAWSGDPAALAGVLGSMVERTAYMQAVVGESYHDYAFAATWVWAQALGIDSNKLAPSPN